MDVVVRVFLILLLVPLLSSALPAWGAQHLRILLTNDDGYEAPGLKAVHRALTAAGHDVYVVAPATQQSGSSAAITSGGVEVTRHEGQVWAVHGRPADAVRFGLGYVLYDFPPDLVVSGANLGQNTGQEINVSGTVGAAVTAFKLGVPAIAISVAIRLDEAKTGFPSTFGAFDGAARTLVRIIDNMDLDDMTAVLNVNYPAARPLDIKGIRWSEVSDHSLLARRYYRKADGKYAPEFQGIDPAARARDAESVVDGYVTLTFLDGDMSIDTRRAQKYLAEHLLDRQFEPEAPQRVKPRKVKPEPAPVKSEGKAHHVVPAAVTKPSGKPETVPKAGPVREIREAPEQEAPQARKEPEPEPESEPEPEPDPDPDPGHVPYQPSPPDPILRGVEPPRESPQSDSQDAEPESQPRKKPDSWLRRIFDPGSWRG